jgi:hypothetical protein
MVAKCVLGARLLPLNQLVRGVSIALSVVLIGHIINRVLTLPTVVSFLRD